MISKQEVKEYLDSMFALEMKMKKTYDHLIKEIKDKKLKHEFMRLSKDESEHGALVKDLMDLLKNWKS